MSELKKAWYDRKKLQSEYDRIGKEQRKNPYIPTDEAIKFQKSQEGNPNWKYIDSSKFRK